MALIDDAPRSATITADTDVRAFGMTPWEFKPFVLSHPEVAWSMLRSLSSRVREAQG
jgi:CRP/FNR family transcriptional regulator